MNHYSTLGIAEGASQAEIRKAYLKLARKFHPDKNPDPVAADKFKKISHAHEVLTGKAKDDPVVAARESYSFSNKTYATFSFSTGLDPLFTHLFGNGFHASFAFQGGPNGGMYSGKKRKKSWSQENSAKRARDAKPAMLIHKLACTLEELAKGCEKKISVTSKLFREDGTEYHKNEKLSVCVKAGFLPGTKMTYKNLGCQDTPGGLRGDICVLLAAKQHKNFILERRDTVFVVPLTPPTPHLSYKLQIYTVTGEWVEKKIRGPLVYGSEHRIPSLGFPHSAPGGVPGDLVVRFVRAKRKR